MISPEWRALTIATAILPVEAERLRELAKGKNVLEIGAAHGYSAIIMALAGATHITSVDSHGPTWLGDTYTSMTNNLEAFGVSDKVTIVCCDSLAAMTKMVEAGFKYHFIFLDGSAIKSENQDDIRLGRKLLVPGGTLAMHDYGHIDYPDKKKVLDEAFPEGAYRITNSLFEITL